MPQTVTQRPSRRAATIALGSVFALFAVLYASESFAQAAGGGRGGGGGGGASSSNGGSGGGPSPALECISKNCDWFAAKPKKPNPPRCVGQNCGFTAVPQPNPNRVPEPEVTGSATAGRCDDTRQGSAFCRADVSAVH